MRQGSALVPFEDFSQCVSLRVRRREVRRLIYFRERFLCACLPDVGKLLPVSAREFLRRVQVNAIMITTVLRDWQPHVFFRRYSSNVVVGVA